MSLPSPPRRSPPDRSLSGPEVPHDPAAALDGGHQSCSQTPSTKSISPPFSPDHGALHTHLLNSSSQAAYNTNASANVSRLGPVRQHGLIREIVNNRFVFRCALFASLGGILFGYDQGVVSVTLVMSHFTTRFPQIDQGRDGGASASFWKGFLTAMIELGAVFGVTLAGFTADKYGRKSAIETGTIFFLVGSVFQTAAFKFPMLIIGRLVAGIGIGLLSMTAPMYMSEISPPSIRGALLCLEEFNIVLGIVVAFWITYGTRFIDSEFSWRFPFGLQMLPAIVILLGLSQLPSSPSWLASKGRNSECLESLATLRQLSEEDASVRKEWVDIRVEAEFQRQHDLDRFGETGDDWWSEVKVEAWKWAEIFTSGCRKRTFVGAGVGLMV